MSRSDRVLMGLGIVLASGVIGIRSAIQASQGVPGSKLALACMVVLFGWGVYVLVQARHGDDDER